jgi:hypothetical protein
MIGILNRNLILLTALACWAVPARAAVPPVEQLLPADTLGLISIPDWDKAMAACEKSPTGQLWRDAAIKPFKEKVLQRWNEDVVVRIEKELGIKFTDFTGLIHGQVTLAVTQNGWDGRSDKQPGLFLLIDTKDRSDRLKSVLVELKKKWVDSGRQIKSEKIREVEFTTLLIRKDELTRALTKAFPATGPAGADKSETPKNEDKWEISFGQSESLLMIATAPKDLEKVLIRQAGGSVATLAEEPAYEANHAALFRDALVFAWVHFKPVYDILNRQAAAAASPDVPVALRPEKILAATGLGGLKTVAFKASAADEGELVEVFLGVPESNRQGLFKILTAEAKETAPPAFVPADAINYSRWRLDSQKAWAALEAMLTAISPEIGGLLQMGLSTIGKDKDPNFDLKKSLIGNLGNDFIVYEKKPRAATLTELSSPPALYLIGSANAEQLAQALKAGTSILPPSVQDATLQEREFQGRKIYSLPLPPAPGLDGGKPLKLSLNFAASGGYVAISTDTAILEEFLRSGESTGKPLRETAGLGEAAQKVGGMSTGFFGYENQSESLRGTFETLKNDSATLRKLFSLPALQDKPGADAAGQEKEWFDFALLPPFDQIAKYFHIVVYSGSATSSGLSWKLFAPTPPQLK